MCDFTVRLREIMAHNKPSTSGESDLIVHKRERFRGQSRNIIFNVGLYTFLKKLSSEHERQKIDFSKTQELTVQACGKGSLHTVSRIIQEAKQSLKEGKLFTFKLFKKTLKTL